MRLVLSKLVGRLGIFSQYRGPLDLPSGNYCVTSYVTYAYGSCRKLKEFLNFETNNPKIDRKAPLLLQKARNIFYFKNRSLKI